MKYLVNNGEVVGVSKLQFLPNQKIKAIIGTFVGYEGSIVRINKNRKRITACSFLTGNGLTFDLKYEEFGQFF